MLTYQCFIFSLVFVSIAIGREGGVAPLIALARSEAEVSILPYSKYSGQVIQVFYIPW